MSERRPLHEPIRRELAHLAEATQRFAGLSEATPLRLRCEHALEHFTQRQQAMPQPMLVAIVGGSGVGKSQLFNTLIEREEASPVSADRRCFTDRPIVAANPADRPRINWLDQLGARYIDVPTMNELVLIDTPDLNGDVPGHAQIARQVIEQSDLVLFVTIPDERADYDLLHELDQAKHRQRWLFVMNKIDREPARLGEIQRDFDRRLKQLGLAADEKVRFTVSATDARQYDLPRLRDQLFRTRPAREVKLSRLELTLGHAQHAVDKDVTAPLRRRAQDLQGHVQRLQAQVRDAYAHALEREQVQKQMRTLVRQQAWMHVAGRIGWPMSLAIGLRNRVAFLAAGYHLTRLVMGQVTPVRLAKVAVSSLLAAAQGVVPTMRLADRLGDDLVRTLEQVRMDAERILQDHGLGHLAEPAGETSSQTGEPATGLDAPEDQSADRGGRFSLRAMPERVAKATVDESQRRITHWLGTLISPASAGAPLLGPLQRSLDEAGEAAVQRSIGWISRIVTNLLPWAAIGHVLYRVGEAWARADYLPLEFYLQALIVLIASVLPGFIWVSLALRRRGRLPDTRQLLESITQPQATAPLREAGEQLMQLAGRAGRLHGQIIELRRQLRSEMAAPLGETPLESRQVL